MKDLDLDHPVLLDFESRSRADLTEVGGRRYWEDPSSEALCCAWFDVRTRDCGCWEPGEEWPHTGRILGAHNAHGFDRFAAERYDFRAAGWVDTSQLARKAGLPGSLDALGTRWLGIPKDGEGSKFTKSLSSVRRPKDMDAATWKALPDSDRRRLGALPEITPEKLARVKEYCVSDVAILVHAWDRLNAWRDDDAASEALDRVINDRGIRFDQALAQRLLEEDARHASEAIENAITEITQRGGNVDAADVRAAARSTQQFCAITGAENAQKTTIAGVDHPLVAVRQALATVIRGKLEAGLTRVHADGRLRDTLRYYGAHTGRWSGRGMQLQNLTRPAKRFDGTDVDALAAAVLDGRPCDAEEASLLLRATLCAAPGHVLIAMDFASVEARATAWAADDHAALEVFRSGKDPYKVAAATIFGTTYDLVDKAQRAVGKVSELALGYGGGPAALEKMAKSYRVDLSGLNLQGIVNAWRTLHDPVCALWVSFERSFRCACEDIPTWAGPFHFPPSTAAASDDIACALPSGRLIVYPNATATEKSLKYQGTKHVEHVYGGKLVENAIQALCRDLLAQALLGAERAGLRPVLHVHDEIVCEVPEAQAQEAEAALHACMTKLPIWAAGFPIAAEGWTGRHYRK
jgi:DNA polymerase